MTEEQIKELEERLQKIEEQQAQLELDVDTIYKRLYCN